MRNMLPELTKASRARRAWVVVQAAVLLPSLTMNCSAWREREISAGAVITLLRNFRGDVMTQCADEPSNIQEVCGRSQDAATSIRVAAGRSETGVSPNYYYSLRTNVRTVSDALGVDDAERVVRLEGGTRGLELKAARTQLGGVW